MSVKHKASDVLENYKPVKKIKLEPEILDIDVGSRILSREFNKNAAYIRFIVKMINFWYENN